MIHVFGLAYGVADYVARSVDSIVETAGEEICLTVIENPSRATPEIEAAMRARVADGRVYRYVQLAENVLASAFLDITDLYLERDAGVVYSAHDFIVWTDLDLLVPKRPIGWATQLSYVIGGGHVFNERTGVSYRLRQPPDLAAFSLSLENYVPPNGGHLDVPNRSGVWLMGMRRSFFATLERERVHLDVMLCVRAEERGGFHQVPYPKLYHLGWDLWRDAPWYWEQKVAGTPWDTYRKPVVATVVERAGR